MILDGKKLREELLANYKNIIEKENLKIKLAIIQVGDNEASNIYVKNKEKYCNMVGIKTDIYKLSSDTKEEELINLIDKLNKIKEVTGIILQSPVPKHIDYDKCSFTGSLLCFAGVGADFGSIISGNRNSQCCFNVAE